MQCANSGSSTKKRGIAQKKGSSGVLGHSPPFLVHRRCAKPESGQHKKVPIALHQTGSRAPIHVPSVAPFEPTRACAQPCGKKLHNLVLVHRQPTFRKVIHICCTPEIQGYAQDFKVCKLMSHKEKVLLSTKNSKHLLLLLCIYKDIKEQQGQSKNGAASSIQPLKTDAENRFSEKAKQAENACPTPICLCLSSSPLFSG